jgi:two-component system, NarL family, invasion response regulator UvrY
MIDQRHILLADDHAIVRRGLSYLLSSRLPSVRVQEVVTCAQLMDKLAKEQFHLLILDVVLPDGNTIDILPELVQFHPELPILMYSMTSEDVYADRAIQIGARGFVSKAEEEGELLRAVQQVMRGQIYRSPSLEMRIHEPHAHEQEGDPFKQLSDRELSVMDQLLRGTSIGSIAQVMGVAGSTAATYKARLFNKLGVSNVLDLQRKADLHGYKLS